MVRQKIRERVEYRVAPEACSHYWVIETANGPRSSGVCKYCGEKRVFMNTLPQLGNTKWRSNPLDLPVIDDVEMEDESKS